ncbi:MAG: methionyl-tRNA formyltransferase [Tenericutes bacterium HGW-Tenericutes-4]|jgi:methionyl-tRNA formyltransferase|nr:MAG: methionyl-tRNA formyltransferase [Tenericutes bacterium HGW-Tenericutes-4]
MKIIFLGTPEFAVSVLDKLVHSKHEILAVVTQPDKPVGRSLKLQAPPVKEFAIAHNIPVFQFEKIKRPENVEALKNLNADIMITAAYGQILNQAVLNITPYGVYNVHGSLLPKYRGAAPIQWAIINGEEVTGVTIMKTSVGLDSGDMLLKQELIIAPTDTSETLFNKMSEIAGDVLLKALDMLENGNFTLTPQVESEATHFPMLEKNSGCINFHKTVKEIDCLVRGVTPWPGAFTCLTDYIKVLAVSPFITSDEVLIKKIESARAGQIILANTKQGLVLKAKDGAIRLNEIQPQNRKKMSDIAYLNGTKINCL